MEAGFVFGVLPASKFAQLRFGTVRASCDVASVQYSAKELLGSKTQKQFFGRAVAECRSSASTFAMPYRVPQFFCEAVAEAPLPSIPFVKMHGIGNDYVYVNAIASEYPNEPLVAIKMSDRHKGVGGDGVIFIKKSTSDAAKFRMQMHNADGSQSEMCGNGLRCVAKFLYDRKLEASTTFPIQTGAGILTVQIFPDPADQSKAQYVRVNMGEPILERAKIPVAGGDATSRVVNEVLEVAGQQFTFTSVSMGNPHCIIYVDDVHNFPVHQIGPLIENHPLFPRRVNVEFIQVVSPDYLIQRTWERGSGETLACGTGASAVCVAGVLTGKSKRRVKISLLGGDLQLEWNEKDNRVYKTGPAEEVFQGTWVGYSPPK